MRMQDVVHNMNLVECDLRLNKVTFKHLKDLEGQLGVNTKFKHDKQRIAEATEVKIMKASKIELTIARREQRRLFKDLAEVENDTKYWQKESNDF